MVERKRHLAKACTYRFFGSAATGVIGYAVSGSAEVGAAVGLADTVAKIGLYYLHERVWYRVKWGVKGAHAAEPAAEAAAAAEPAIPAVVVIPARREPVMEVSG